MERFEVTNFKDRNRRLTHAMADDDDLSRLSSDWMRKSAEFEYTYHFTWLGLPIIQYPQDMLAIQEIIWSTQPDVVIETGIARGGSLIFSASLLELIGRNGLVVGVDVDIRKPSRVAIESHPLAKRIKMIEGSSTDPDVVEAVSKLVAPGSNVLVLLDSSHTHEHVLSELELYSPFVKPGGYVVVFDTIIEKMPPGSYPEREWDVDNNPATAVAEFLSHTDRFEIDQQVDAKLLISMAPGGYLRRAR